MTLLSVEQLTKTLGSRVLYQGLNFTVHPGEILLISGINGSGKSTLMLELIKSKSKSVNRNYKRFQYLPQTEDAHLPYPITFREILENSTSHNIDYQSFGLLRGAQLSLNFNTASGGEKKRLLLTKALMQTPEVLYLDEPFNHLDQKSIHIITQSLLGFIKLGQLKALVVVSHQAADYFQNYTGLKEIHLG